MNKTQKKHRRIGLGRLKDDLSEIVSHNKSLRDWTEEKYVNDAGEAVISVFVNNGTVWNPLSDPRDRRINDDIYSYVDEQEHIIPAEYPLVINLVSKEEIQDKATIEKLIKDHYYIGVSDALDDQKRNRFTWNVLFLLGIVLFAVYFTLLYAFPDGVLFNEIFSTAATFTIWEAFDYLIISGNVIKIQQLHAAQLATSKIRFEILKEKTGSSEKD